MASGRSWNRGCRGSCAASTGRSPPRCRGRGTMTGSAGRSRSSRPGRRRICRGRGPLRNCGSPGRPWRALPRGSRRAPRPPANLVFHPSTWSTAPYCYLEDLFVTPSARGTGTARELLDAVFAEAARPGAHILAHSGVQRPSPHTLRPGRAQDVLHRLRALSGPAPGSGCGNSRSRTAAASCHRPGVRALRCDTPGPP